MIADRPGTARRRPAAAKPPEKRKGEYTMFENLKKAIDRSEKEDAEKVYNRAKKDDIELRQLLTYLQWENYTTTRLTREKALELAKKKAAREAKKRADRYRERLTAAEGANPSCGGLLVIRFVRNSTWGWNPRADLFFGGMTFTGRASGCGYDKASAAMAEALNACPAIMRALYAKEDKRQDGVIRLEWIGYGSGYGVLPAFEGGVGVSTLCNVLEACGFYVESTQARDKTYYIRITEGGTKK